MDISDRHLNQLLWDARHEYVERFPNNIKELELNTCFSFNKVPTETYQTISMRKFIVHQNTKHIYSNFKNTK